MATLKIQQYRFYSFGSNDKNNPTDNMNNDGVCRWADNLLQDTSDPTKVNAIVKLGIQTLPGVKFSFTGGGVGQLPTDRTDIVIDFTGVYELDLRDVSAQITSLSFNAKSLALIDSLPNAGIIVDVAAFSEGGES